MGITQDNRQLKITTPLGKDVLLVDEFSGAEEVSRPFQFEIALLADVAAGNHKKVDPSKLLGQPVTLEIVFASGKSRFINGIVRRFRVGPLDEAFARYRMEIVPRLALMDMTSDCRIFQDQAVPDVLQQVLKDAGVDVKLGLTRSYTKLDYCVQYRETDFNFFSRLAEAEGIFYYFEHANGSHTLVLSDRLGDCKPCPEHDTFDYGSGAADIDGSGVIEFWEERSELFPGKWAMRDYHFELPTNTLEVTEPALKPAPTMGSYEMYDYPGEYAQRFNKPGERLGNVKQEGTGLVKLRMEELEAASVVVDGTSTCRSLVAGYKLTVESRGDQQVKGTYVLTSVQHSATQVPGYDGAGAGGTGSGGGYRNRFVCIPDKAVFRPPRVTRKPVVQGPQPAIVVTDTKGEEIWPDKYGRVKVRFFWDRENKNACWVRVAQQRAGLSGGFIWIPRVGDEVLVAFLEGDPDCPVVIGSVYNADNPVPYKLPDNKTQSGIKSRSTAKGGADNFNELRFEDKKGSEEVFMQAEKDFTVNVKNDRTTTIGNNETLTVDKGDRKTIQKQGSHITTIEKGDQTLEIKLGKQTNTIQGNVATTIKQGNLEETLDMGNQTTTLKMGKQETNLKMGDQTTTLDLGNQTTTCKIGNITIKASLGKITLEALQGIELKVGTNSVKVDMTGITVKGLMTKIEGDVQTSVKGLMTQVDGSAMLMAKGAITMIG